MAGPNDLTGQYIKSTYSRVLQVGSDGNMYDGTGSLYIPRSASYEINKETSSSYAETASFANNFNVAGDITASGNISASGQLRGADLNLKGVNVLNFSTANNRIVVGNKPTFFNGNITASGDISCSTAGSIISAHTGSFPHFITTGTTIEFRDKMGPDGVRIGAMRYNESDGFELRNNADDGRQKMKLSQLDAETVVANNSLTAKTKLEAPGFTASSKLLQLGSPTNEGQTLVVYGKIQSKGSDLTIMSGSITASGDISSSATVIALTGSFGTGTTHIHDNIQTANIKATGNIEGASVSAEKITAVSGKSEVSLGEVGDTVDLIVQGKIRVKGSEVFIGDGHISASGNITASGDISSSGIVSGLTGSFGTGTTTITDKIYTTGNIQSDGSINATQVVASRITAKGEDGIVELGEVGSNVTAIINGKIKIRGSGIELGEGNISMSGDLLATGSIQTDGNITAGDGGTGSFDHIITLDDTIEFRDKSDKKKIKGYVKFDATNGLVPKDKDKADLPRLADRLSTPRRIGGVAFDGSAHITPKTHMGSDSIIKILPHDFPTGNLVYNVGGKGANLLNLNAKVQTVYLTTQIPIGTTISSIRAFGSGKNSVVTLRGLNIDGSYATSAFVFTNEKTKFGGTEIPVDEVGTQYDLSNKSDDYTSSATNYLVIALTLAPEGGTFTGLLMSFS